MEEQSIYMYFEQSAEIGDVAKALSAVQGKLPNAIKDSTNPEFGKSYADLASCWDACRVPLAENGLAVVQFPSARGTAVTVVTSVIHAPSGQWFRCRMELIAANNTAHAITSCITTIRRYSLCAMIGISPAEDDGNAASGRGTPQGRTQTSANEPLPPQESKVTIVSREASPAPSNGKPYIVEDTGKNPDSKEVALAEIRMADERVATDIKTQVADIAASLIKSTSGLTKGLLGEFYMGWFNLTDKSLLPKDPAAYLEPLESLQMFISDPAVPPALLTSPKVVGQQMREYKVPESDATEPAEHVHSGDDKEIFSTPLLDYFKWKDMNTATWGEEFMGKMAFKEPEQLKKHLTMMNMLELPEEDLQALMKLLSFSTEAYAVWKKASAKKMPVSIALRTVEHALGHPVTKDSKRGEVEAAIKKASAEL